MSGNAYEATELKPKMGELCVQVTRFTNELLYLASAERVNENLDEFCWLCNSKHSAPADLKLCDCCHCAFMNLQS